MEITANRKLDLSRAVSKAAQALQDMSEGFKHDAAYLRELAHELRVAHEMLEARAG